MATLGGEGVRVILVGTGSHVSGSRFPDVPAVAATMHALENCLIDVCGVRKENLVSLLNPNGPEVFLDVVIAAAEAATDVLLIYYVGHGAISPAGNFHLATRATVDLGEKAAYQALPYSEIIGVVVNCRARLVVVVLDCCYSGRATNPVRSGALLGSADYDEQALAPAGEPYTAFSGELIRALHEGIPTAPAEIKLRHLHDHLSRVMRARNRPIPILQTGHLAGELVLASNRAYRPEPNTWDPDSGVAREDSCPYRGLDAFSAEDEDVFYGRSNLINQVVDRLGECVSRGGIAVVSGPSGSGKTSLLSAGVVPAILHGSLGILGSSRWPHILMTPGDDPLGVLAVQLAQLDPSADAESIRSQLTGGPEQARATVMRVATVGSLVSSTVSVRTDRLLIVVDQFEELFTPVVSEVDRRAFITTLQAAATYTESTDPPAIVLLGLRSDFNGHCARFSEIVTALENNHVVVGPMTTAELRSAIVEPAKKAGLTLEAGLVDLLLRDTGADPGDDYSADYDPGALPLLSHALLTTWQHRRGNLLTVDGYREVGGVSGSISTTAERTFTALEPQVQHAAKFLLLRMIRIGEDIPDTRRQLHTDDILATFPERAAAEMALEAFAKSRLVTVDADTAEITHEALIRSWPRLRQWIDADRAGQLVIQELEAVASDWRRSGQDATLLFRGSRLATALTTVQASTEVDLSTAALQFIAASHRHERRAIWVRQAIVAVLVILTALATTGAILAIKRGNQLDRQLAAANAQNFATAAISRAVDDPAFSTKLALDAWYRDRTNPTARDALAHQYLSMQSVDKIYANFTDQRINELYSSADGNTLTLVHDNGATIVNGFLGPAPMAWMVAGVPAKTGLAASPTGRWLLGVNQDGTVLLWDIRARAGPYFLFRGNPTTTGRNYIAAFAPDDSRLVIVAPSAGASNQDLTLWDPARRTRITTAPNVLGNQLVTNVWLTNNPRNILVRTGQASPSPAMSLTERSLYDGAIIHTFPSSSVVIRHGEAVATCKEGDYSSNTPASIILLESDTGSDIGQVPMVDKSCGFPGSNNVLSTADGNHIVVNAPLNRSQLFQPVRLTNLATGDSFDFIMPPGRGDATDTSLAMRLDPSMTVIESQSGPPTILVARNSSILRIHPTARDWIGQTGIMSPIANASSNGRYIFVGSVGAGFRAIDRQSGQQLGEITRNSFLSDTTDTAHVMVFDSLDFLVHSDAGWLLLQYPGPSLHPNDPIILPSPPNHVDSDQANAAEDDKRIVAVAAGVVSVFDARSKKMIGGPLTLGETPDEKNRFRSLASFKPRPGHPDEIAVTAPDGSIQLWSLSQRRRLKTIRIITGATESAFAFDSTGTNLIAFTNNHTLEQWNVDSGTQVHTPWPAPNTSEVDGFTADGYLLTLDFSGPTLQFWDLKQGLISGTMPLGGYALSSTTLEEPIIREYSFDELGLMPVNLSMTDRIWSERLCAISGRDFTNHERTVLPPGTSAEIPCTS